MTFRSTSASGAVDSFGCTTNLGSSSSCTNSSQRGASAANNGLTGSFIGADKDGHEAFCVTATSYHAVAKASARAPHYADGHYGAHSSTPAMGSCTLSVASHFVDRRADRSRAGFWHDAIADENCAYSGHDRN